MRTFNIPKPQRVPATAINEQGQQVAVERDFTFKDFLDQFVWPSSAWRATSESSDAWFTSLELLDGAAEGATVTFDDVTWAVFKPIATLQGKDLPGLAAQLSRLMRPILQARQVAKEDL